MTPRRFCKTIGGAGISSIPPELERAVIMEDIEYVKYVLRGKIELDSKSKYWLGCQGLEWAIRANKTDLSHFLYTYLQHGYIPFELDESKLLFMTIRRNIDG